MTEHIGLLLFAQLPVYHRLIETSASSLGRFFCMAWSCVRPARGALSSARTREPAAMRSALTMRSPSQLCMTIETLTGNGPGAILRRWTNSDIFPRYCDETSSRMSFLDLDQLPFVGMSREEAAIPQLIAVAASASCPSPGKPDKLAALPARPHRNTADAARICPPRPQSVSGAHRRHCWRIALDLPRVPRTLRSLVLGHAATWDPRSRSGRLSGA